MDSQTATPAFERGDLRRLLEEVHALRENVASLEKLGVKRYSVSPKAATLPLQPRCLSSHTWGRRHEPH